MDNEKEAILSEATKFKYHLNLLNDNSLGYHSALNAFSTARSRLKQLNNLKENGELVSQDVLHQAQLQLEDTEKTYDDWSNKIIESYLEIKKLFSIN